MTFRGGGLMRIALLARRMHRSPLHGRPRGGHAPAADRDREVGRAVNPMPVGRTVPGRPGCSASAMLFRQQGEFLVWRGGETAAVALARGADRRRPCGRSALARSGSGGSRGANADTALAR